jgi:TrwC relaxase
VLTLSKVVVEVENRADAARAGDYRLELEAAPEAFARTDYQLAEQALERRSERGSSVWLGADDALSQFGVRRGQAIERDDLIAVLQGQHVDTGEQLRRPGALKREARDEHGQTLLDDDGRPVVERVTGVAHVEMTMSVPKSVSVLWAMAGDADRWRIEEALLAAAERTVQYMARNKAVIYRRGKDGVRVREPAAGAAVASSLHVTARRARGDRAPAPAAARPQPRGRRQEVGRVAGGGGFVGVVSPRHGAGGRRAVPRPGRRCARPRRLGNAFGHRRPGPLLRGGGRAREPVRGDVAAIARGGRRAGRDRA